MKFFKNIYVNIITILSAVVGFLLYWLSLKNRERNMLKTKIELADDQKKADLIEIEIKEHLENKKLLKKEIDDRKQLLEDLKEKRKKIQKKNEKMTDKEIEDYWNES